MDLKAIVSMLRQRTVDRPRFSGSDVTIGKGVTFGRNVVFNCKRVCIGDGVVFHDNIMVNSEVFEIGDYGTVYSYCFFPGPGVVQIGHNFWLGYASVVDGMGGTKIGNNVGIGAQSQLWTHMRFGDIMYGCKFHSEGRLNMEDDAWLLPGCTISPVTVGARSLAMSGSVVTKDMIPDHTYAGVPATDVTDKFGSQFRLTTAAERVNYLMAAINDFATKYNVREIDKYVRITSNQEDMLDGSGTTVFNVSDRTYSKKNTGLERTLMRFLLPDAKFVPVE